MLFVTEVVPILIIVLLAAVIVLQIIFLRKTSQADAPNLASRLDGFEKTQERAERAVREEAARSRDELGKAAREQRQELAEAFKTFGDSVVQRMMDSASAQKSQFEVFSGQLTAFTKASGERLDGIRLESASGAKQLREEVAAAISKLADTNEKKLEAVRVAVEQKLQSIQTDNAKQLEQMRQTVDEKLQGTL
ncbi:MAG: hypothetical protein MUC65_00090 [Pontiellaceae bacterium]|jgi:DNA recombination protein RmuC|nr:hypothetical protein [Pontiellaceae bacterium]